MKMNVEAQLNLLEEMATYSKNLFADSQNKDTVQDKNFLSENHSGLRFFESFIHHLKPSFSAIFPTERLPANNSNTFIDII